MAQKISNLAVGTLVKFGTFHGVPVVWKIADKNHSGYPANSVTLLSNQVLKLMCFDAKEVTHDSDRALYGYSRYLHSNIRQWLNSDANAGEWFVSQHFHDISPQNSATLSGLNGYDKIAGFLNAFSAKEQDALLNTTITAAIDSISSTTKAETLTDRMFLLSCAEVGVVGDSVQGVLLPIFSDDTSRQATVTAQCVSNAPAYSNLTAGAVWGYWLRDADVSATWRSRNIAKNGRMEITYSATESIGLRPACNLSGDLMVTDTADADGSYTILYNAAPTAPVSITVPATVYGGKAVAITWGAASDPDGNLAGYVVEASISSGAWSQIYKGAATTCTVNVAHGATTAQFRVKAYDAMGAESAYTTSPARTVINNRTPVVSGSDADLGTFAGTAPSASYTVTDADGDVVTVVEKLDGVTLRQYTAALGASNVLTFDASRWRSILNGRHTMTVTATDPMGASVTRTLTFTKAVTSIRFEQALAMSADAMPTRAILNIQGSFPTGSTLTVWICNNGNDAAPTWEEVTQKVLSRDKIFFNNDTKTAASWGVKIRVDLQRGTATEACYIQSIGGNFA